MLAPISGIHELTDSALNVHFIEPAFIDRQSHLTDHVVFVATQYATYAAHTDLQGSGDYTVDCWVYLTSTVATQDFAANSDATAGAYLLRMIAGGQLVVYSSSNGSSFDIASAVNVGTIAAATWVHVAFVRSGSNYFTFMNGVQGATFASALAPVSGKVLTLGANATGAQPTTGCIAEFRISKIARWTAAFNINTIQEAWG